MIKHFYPNEPDNVHCMQSCIRMVIHHFEDRPVSLEEAEQLTGFIEGKETWQYGSISSLAGQGYDVKIVEKFDIPHFVQDPKEMLIKNFGVETYELFNRVSDIHHAAKEAQKCLDSDNVNIQYAIPTYDDLRNLIDDGFLVVCNVNSNKLAGKDGYTGHVVVVDSINDKAIILQNPGLPAIQDQEVTLEAFMQAWDKPNDGRELFAFRKAL